jgi:hypothetical protein
MRAEGLGASLQLAAVCALDMKSGQEDFTAGSEPKDAVMQLLPPRVELTVMRVRLA